MPNLIDVNVDELEKKASFFKRNYYEIGFIVMAVVISYLFVGQKQLERDMRNYLISDRTAAFQKMDATTEVIKKNTDVMQDVSGTLKRIEEENQERNLKR